MSKRAEQKAQRAYTDHEGFTFDDERKAYAKGYEQAEKDLALTWEDIKAIVTIADSMLTGTAWDAIEWPDQQKYYEEVLRHFNEQREKI